VKEKSMSGGPSHSRRDQIRAAAKELFRTRGYLATSMRHIAREIDLSGGGSLYAHITGKEELLWEIANDAIDAFFQAQDRVIGRDLPPRDRLAAAMIAHVDVILSHLDAAAVYFDEWRHLGEARRAEFAARRDRYETRFQELLHDGIAAGVFEVADERMATLVVLGTLNAVRRWYRPDGRLSAATVAQMTADLAMNGLLIRK
jgi:AcrR family transcriptional regulator